MNGILKKHAEITWDKYLLRMKIVQRTLHGLEIYANNVINALFKLVWRAI